MTTNRDTYKKEFAEFIKEKGPNTGTGFFGAWAWHAKRQKEFEKAQEDQAAKA